MTHGKAEHPCRFSEARREERPQQNVQENSPNCQAGTILRPSVPNH
jgi:hypothetical protein